MQGQKHKKYLYIWTKYMFWKLEVSILESWVIWRWQYRSIFSFHLTDKHCSILFTNSPFWQKYIGIRGHTGKIKIALLPHFRSLPESSRVTYEAFSVWHFQDGWRESTRKKMEQVPWDWSMGWGASKRKYEVLNLKLPELGEYWPLKYTHVCSSVALGADSFGLEEKETLLMRVLQT